MVSADVWLVKLSALFEPLSSAAARSRPVGAAGGNVSFDLPRAATRTPTAPRPASPRPIVVPERPPEPPSISVLPDLTGAASGWVDTLAPPPLAGTASTADCADEEALSAASSTFTTCFLPFSVNDKIKSLPTSFDFTPDTNAPVAVSTISTLAPTKGGSSFTRALKATFLTVPFAAVIRIDFVMVIIP